MIVIPKRLAVVVAGAVSLGSFEYTSRPINPIDHSLDGTTLGRIDEDTRRNLADRLATRADGLLDELGLGGLKRWAIMTFFVRGQLDKLLGFS